MKQFVVFLKSTSTVLFIFCYTLVPNSPQYELVNDNQTSNKEDLSRLKGLYDLF